MAVEYDQHFLVDTSVLDKTISEAQISSEDVILEIGPGKGALTKEILKKNPEKLIAIELDRRFEDELRELENEYFSFHLELGNGLEKLDKFVYNKLIANIPYAITEPLYRGLIKEQVEFAILLHGIDFYKNIAQRETKWKYFVPAFYNVELLKEVPGTAFNPTTKVTSALVKLTLKKEFSKQDEFFRNLYHKETRNLKNAIIYSVVDTLGIPKREVKLFLESLGIEHNIMEELLSQTSNEVFCFLIEEILNKFFKK